MINIKIICVGKIKENSLKQLIAEYEKRLSKYCKLDIIEIEDEKVLSVNSNAEKEKIKQKECLKIKEKLDKIGKSTVFFMDLGGKQYSSEQFASKLQDLPTYGSSTLVFVIGGTLGLSDELLSIKSEKISFSKMTFPHQLFRVFLLEQIFRAFKIQNNETYHQ